MNSEVSTNNYATSTDMLYGAHWITLVSDKVTYDNPSGKFSLSYIAPNIGSNEYERKTNKISTSNVVNKDNLGITSITTSNYITLSVPKYFFYITEIPITPNTTINSHCGGLNRCNPQNNIKRKEYTKGQRFLVVNAGGNVDSPFIVGVE